MPPAPDLPISDDALAGLRGGLDGEPAPPEALARVRRRAAALVRRRRTARLGGACLAVAAVVALPAVGALRHEGGADVDVVGTVPDEATRPTTTTTAAVPATRVPAPPPATGGEGEAGAGTTALPGGATATGEGALADGPAPVPEQRGTPPPAPAAPTTTTSTDPPEVPTTSPTRPEGTWAVHWTLRVDPFPTATSIKVYAKYGNREKPADTCNLTQPHTRMRPPVVVEHEDYVVILLAADPPDLTPITPEDPLPCDDFMTQSRYEVHLSAPLGDRALYDGSTTPPAPARFEG